MQVKNPVFSTISTEEKVRLLKKILEEQKAADIRAFDVREITQMANAMILVNASSLRHGKALADTIYEEGKKEQLEILRREGYEAAQWILIDLNDVIIHIFQVETRKLYNLEALWHKAIEI